ncbi:MAG: hypothetical protein C5B54_07390, partial [Acidobacteria bacterium]
LPIVRNRVRILEEDKIRLIVDEAGSTIPQLRECLAQNDIAVQSIKQYFPPLGDVIFKIMESSYA